jgi:hypothetical protein
LLWIISGKSQFFSGIIARIKTKSGGRNMRYSQALALMISGSYLYMVYWPCSNSTRITEGGSSGQRANSIDLPEGEYHPGDSLAFAGWVASPQG